MPDSLALVTIAPFDAQTPQLADHTSVDAVDLFKSLNASEIGAYVDFQPPARGYLSLHSDEAHFFLVLHDLVSNPAVQSVLLNLLSSHIYTLLTYGGRSRVRVRFAREDSTGSKTTLDVECTSEDLEKIQAMIGEALR